MQFVVQLAVQLAVQQIHNNTHIHFTTLWILSGITQMSRYQNQSRFY